MKLLDLRREFLKIKKQGYERGFTFQDYQKLLKIQNQINPLLCNHQQKWMDFYNEIQSLLNGLYDSGLFATFSQKNISYIKENTHLLPLVLANNKGLPYKLTTLDFYFQCQFHTEKTPSMRLKGSQNTGHCFGCGVGFDSISYLQQYEKINFRKAIQLLAQIYLFDIKKEDLSLNTLVEHYQDTILSEEYSAILNKCLEKLENQNFESKDTICEKYQKRFATIERIKNHEYDKSFIYDPPKRKLYLK